MANIEKKKNYIVEFSPIKSIMKFKKVKSSIEAYKSGAETLGQISRSYNDEYLMSFINIWIADLNEYLNIRNKLTPNQIEQISVFIIQDYYYLNIADINLIFSGIKKGAYGQFYESIDGLKLLSIFNEYSESRANQIYESELNEHNSNKEYDINRREDSKSIKELLTKEIKR